MNTDNATQLDFLCQLKQHSVLHYGQHKGENNLLNHNNGALKIAILDAVERARKKWTIDGKPAVWIGDDISLEQSRLRVGPKWLRRLFATPQLGDYGCDPNFPIHDAHTVQACTRFSLSIC
jgi:hypothetical protein